MSGGMLGTVNLKEPGTFTVRMAVIQPTPFCNINCKYCYLPNRHTTSRMTPEVLEQSFRFLFQDAGRLAGRLVIAWHAGEPLAVPLNFYQSAFELQQRHAPRSVIIENSLQTNAILLNQDWCDFIKYWDVKVGVSIDGPQFLHDVNRVDRQGRGTFDRVMHGIELLRANGIRFGVIGVLSEHSLDFPEEIWRFYENLGVESLALNYENVEGENLASSLNQRTSPAKAQAFWKKLVALRDAERPSVSLREVDYFLKGIPHWGKEFRGIETVPLSIVGIAWNGDISTFSPELIGLRDSRYGDFVFGNVATDTLETVLANPKFLAAYRDISAGVRQCKLSCEYFCLCGGGQPSSKLSENGTFDSAETLACVLRIKAVGTVAMEYLETAHGLSPGSGELAQDRVARLANVIGSAAGISSV